MRIALVGSVIAGSLAAGACGSDKPPTTPPTDGTIPPDAAPPLYEGAVSGERIKLRWYQADEQVKSFKELFDSLRNEVCVPTAFFNANTYCAPVAADVVYADERCTQRLGVTQKRECATAPDPTWFAERTDAACAPAVTRMFRRTSAETVKLAQYYRKVPGGCRRVVSTSSTQLYDLSDELTAASLVAMTATSASPGEGRVVQRVYTTPDGLRAPYATYDTSLATNCTLTTSITHPEQARCIPSNLTEALYTDDGCMEPKAEIPNGCSTDVFIDFSYAPQCPGAEHSYLRLGPPAAGEPLYEHSRTTCDMRSTDATASYFAGGPAVTLPTIARSHDPGSKRRLEPIYDMIDTLKVRSGLYDTMHDAECEIMPVPNTTVTACLPRGTVTRRFSDDACKVPIDVVLVDVGASDCPALPTPQYAIKTLSPVEGECSGSIEVHRVGAAYVDPLYVMGFECIPDDAPGLRAYTTGEVVPLSSFATLSVVTDL